jgi:hypothetical protein
MNTKKRYRLRVESCIGTIIDVHKSVSPPYGDAEFLCQFEKLKKAVTKMDMSNVSESDVLMVEKATNALLGEFKPIFESGDYSAVYESLKQ